jgi:hypothetical protein
MLTASLSNKKRGNAKRQQQHTDCGSDDCDGVSGKTLRFCGYLLTWGGCGVANASDRSVSDCCGCRIGQRRAYARDTEPRALNGTNFIRVESNRSARHQVGVRTGDVNESCVARAPTIWQAIERHQPRLVRRNCKVFERDSVDCATHCKLHLQCKRSRQFANGNVTLRQRRRIAHANRAVCPCNHDVSRVWRIAVETEQRARGAEREDRG